MSKPERKIRTSITLPISVYMDLRSAAQASGKKTPSRYLEHLLRAGQVGGVPLNYHPRALREDFARELRKKARA